MTPEPPTIAHLKGHGLEGLFVVCGNAACLHATAFNFAALDLADDVQFPSIARRGDNSRLKTRSASYLEGLRGEDSIAELCRREGIVQNLYYRWSKDFLEAGKKRLAGDTARAATSDEVQELRREAKALKEAVADLTLENRVLKKSLIADGGDDA